MRKRLRMDFRKRTAFSEHLLYVDPWAEHYRSGLSDGGIFCPILQKRKLKLLVVEHFPKSHSEPVKELGNASSGLWPQCPSALALALPSPNQERGKPLPGQGSFWA